jgi:hypothetical protein
MLGLSTAAGALAACSSAPIAPPPPLVEEPPPGPEHPGDERPTAARSDPLVVATSEPPPSVVAPPACALDLSRLAPSCQVVFPLEISASGGENAASAAFDGSTCTTWNAGGFAPQSITVDLGAPTDVDELVMIPEMTPNGSVVHRIEISDDGRSFAPSQRIEAPMQSGVAVDLRLPRREHARFLRFSTDQSPSWVAWREIAIIRCGTTHGP